MVLLGNDLLKFSETLAIARWTRRIIWQNFTGTIVMDPIGMGLAAVGVLNPRLAAFIHVASEMTSILNSARLLPPVGRSAPAAAMSHHVGSDHSGRRSQCVGSKMSGLWRSATWRLPT